MERMLFIKHGRNALDASVNITYETCADLGIKRANTTDGNLPYQVRQRALHWMIFFILFYGVSMAAFYMLRSKFSMISKRSYFLLVIQCLGHFCNMFSYTVPTYFGGENISCDLIFWLHMMIVPLSTSPLLLRLILVANQISLSRIKASYKIEEEIETLINSNNEDRLTSKSERTTLDMLKSWINATFRFYRVSDQIQPSSKSSTISIRDIKAAAFVTSAPYVLIVLLLVVTPFLIEGLIMFYSLPFLGVGCTGCFLLHKEVIVFLIIAAIIVVGLGLFVAFKLRKIHDHLYVIPEFALTWIFGGTGGIVGLIGIYFYSDIMFQDQLFHWQEPTAVGLTLAHVVSCPWIIFLAWRSQQKTMLKIRRQSILPESHLKTIMHDQVLKELFIQYLESEFNVDQFKFLIIADIWRENYDETNPKVIKQARLIHDNFTSKSALFPVNIPSAMRERICDIFDGKSHSKIDKAIFDDIFEEISKMLALDSLPRFLKSRLYLEHTSNLDAPEIQGSKVLSVSQNIHENV